MFLTADVQKIKYILKLVSLQNYVNICNIMYCCLLTITQTTGCPLVYTYINVSIRNLPSLDFRSSFKSISVTCDDFISNQKIVLFLISILASRFFHFKEVLHYLLAVKSPYFYFLYFSSNSHHCCFLKSSLWTAALHSSDTQFLPQGVLGLSISKRQQMNAAIWSICK